MFDTHATFDAPDQSGRRPRLSPTDIAQFIRLDQCQRYLRLRLHTNLHGQDFLHAYDVAPQSIPPLLTQSGATFEKTIEDDVRFAHQVTRIDAKHRVDEHRRHDNHLVLHAIQSLQAGGVHVIFQPRLEALLGAWDVRGDVVIIRLERDGEGSLHILIVDMKSSSATKIEHRLQVAIYIEMLGTILRNAQLAFEPIGLGVLYRGPAAGTTAADTANPEMISAQIANAQQQFGTDAGLLECVDDPAAYTTAVRDLISRPESLAQRVITTPFDDVPFHLASKCDGCMFNEFCMKRSAETDDLSLIPHLTEQDKRALQRAGIESVTQLAALKVQDPDSRMLRPAPGQAEACQHLAALWPVGPRLDEIIFRAHAICQQTYSGPPAPRFIPHKGYGTLPESSPDLHPNLILIYVDAQQDYLHDRLYMASSRVVAHHNGKIVTERTRDIVHLAMRRPDDSLIEEDLVLSWVQDTLQAVAECASPAADGALTAPIHLVFFDRSTQGNVLGALGRHMQTVFGATALYDLMTQVPVFDSPIVTYLADQVREQRNYPMICQSLQSIAGWLGFDWDFERALTGIFRVRMFDERGSFEGDDTAAPSTARTTDWYTRRARFSSSIPLEYAYNAWGDLDTSVGPEFLQTFGRATEDDLIAFQARRLHALEHIAGHLGRNRQTELTSFDLSTLATFQQTSPTFAHALKEFTSIERFVALQAWREARLAPPEQRVLSGTTLILQYVEDDQEEGIAQRNRENARRNMLQQEFRVAKLEANPNLKRVVLSKQEREVSGWNHDGMLYRLRIVADDLPVSLADAVSLSRFKPGDRVILASRWSVDSRLPIADQRRFTTTAKQLLYQTRVKFERIDTECDHNGHIIAAWFVVSSIGGGGGDGVFTFGYGSLAPFGANDLFTVEDDPNDINGQWRNQAVQGVIDGGQPILYRRLNDGFDVVPIPVSRDRSAAQQRFMQGLVALDDAGLLHDFEPAKHDFIGQHGDTPILLVQGPPGTGKSYSTAFALLARIQGAMAVNEPCRILLSCKTHAATDVLLHNVLNVQRKLAELCRAHPGLTSTWFDARLFDVPLIRFGTDEDQIDGIDLLDKTNDNKKIRTTITATQWNISAATPGQIFKFKTKDDMYADRFIDLVVLDEASQMNIPEALMATLPLKDTGRLIVVGDHRQVPPIVSHDWQRETRRTFQDFRAYESLFETLLEKQPPRINFERSFRLHRDIAEFLRQEIYRHDGINYHSLLTTTIDSHPNGDQFVEAALTPEHPLIVIVHDENGSQQRNLYEQELIAQILRALHDETTYGLSAEKGLGVVVPHRAQRAGLRLELPELSIRDVLGDVIGSAVDTVERFQGDERTVIVIGATESAPDYLQSTGDFLMDPRRINVALSRAKQKLILVAARSIFETFSPDEEQFANAQLWKNLLHRVCTTRLWEGARGGQRVTVWGNTSSPPR